MVQSILSSLQQRLRYFVSSSPLRVVANARVSTAWTRSVYRVQPRARLPQKTVVRQTASSLPALGAFQQHARKGLPFPRFFPIVATAMLQREEEKTLTMKDLEKIASALEIELPAQGEEKASEWQARCQQLCFSAALKACLKQEWEKIEPLKESLGRLKNRWGSPLLFACIEQGSLSCLQEWTGRDIGVDARDQNGNTAFHIAARANRIDALHLFPKRLWAQVNSEGETALHVAILHGREQVVNRLIELGMNQTVSVKKQGLDLTPIGLAVAKGQIPCLDLLIKEAPAGSLSKQVGDVGNLLHLAVQEGQLRVLKHLLTVHFRSCKQLIEGTDSLGRTPVNLAAALGDDEALRFLVKEKGGIINTKDHQGNTPVHLAVLNRQPYVIEELALLGADLHARNNDRATPDLLVKRLKDQEQSQMTEDLEAALVYASTAKKDRKRKAIDFTFFPPENIIWQGGGPRGLAQIGAIQALQERGLLRNVRRMAGTSAGSMTATLAAIGYTQESSRRSSLILTS